MLRLHLVRDHYKSLCYVPTDQNLADCLTKAVPASKYIQIFDASHDVSMDAAPNCFVSAFFVDAENSDLVDEIVKLVQTD